MPQTDAEYWSAKQVELERDQLGTVQKAAASWTTLFGAILGVFGTVAFAGGLTAVDKLSESLQLPVKIMTLVAAALALTATILAGLASSPFPRTTNDTTWQGLQTRSGNRATAALTQLRAALGFGIATAVLVIVGSAGVLIAGEASPGLKVPTVLVTLDDGSVCGKLAGAGPGPTVEGRSLERATSVTVVPACPG